MFEDASLSLHSVTESLPADPSDICSLMGILCAQMVLLNFAILEIRKKRKGKLDHIYFPGGTLY